LSETCGALWKEVLDMLVDVYWMTECSAGKRYKNTLRECQHDEEPEMQMTVT